MKYKTVEELRGETLSLVERNGDEEIIFTTVSGRRFRMYHEQDCCESVEIGSIEGELSALVGSALEVAEERPGHEDSKAHESVTFTDFILVSQSGVRVVIHWIGESNGYYDESVYFVELK